MSTLIDFRNGRYQGQVRDKLPDGVGIFFSIDLTFIIGHWKEGKLFGKAIIIYSNGAIFCGSINNDEPQGICYFQLEKQSIKVFFNGNSSTFKKYAVVIPNFETILELDRPDQKLVGKHAYNRKDIQQNQLQIQTIIEGQMDLENERQYEGVFRYFQQNFSDPYANLFEKLLLNANGIEYWMGFRNQGLGIKIKPLQMHEHNGRTYRICQMGVMTKDNVLFGIGVKTNNSMFNKIKIEEGVFQRSNTLISYQYEDQNSLGLSKKDQIEEKKKKQNKENKRPTKCLATFINFLKRSMFFQNNYLFLQSPVDFRKQIQQISSITFTQMKIQRAHQIIQTPLSNSKVMEQIERTRRKKILQNSQYQKRKYESNQQTNLYNTGLKNKQMLLSNSQLDFTALKEDLQRSISKKKSTKSILQIDQSKNVPKRIIQNIKLPSNDKSKDKLKDRSNSRRKNGSITPTKNKIPSPTQQNKNGVGVVKKQNLSFFSPVKTTQKKRDIIYQKPQQPPVIKKHPSPILKKARVQVQSPPRKKAIFKERQLEDWQKKMKQQQRNFRIEKTISSPSKKYGDLYKQKAQSKASSPVKKLYRPILTQNIFQ